MSLQLRSVEIRGPVDQVQFKTTLEQSPIMFSFDDGAINEVCPSPDDEPWAVNVKKAILSSLQVRLDRNQTSRRLTVVRETDILGTCDTQYEILQQRWGITTIKKTKDMKTCTNRQQARVSAFS